MKTLKALVVRTAPALVWLACAAAVAAADRPSAYTAGAGVGLLPVAPLFLPQHGYTGDLTLLGAPPKNPALIQTFPPPRVVLVPKQGEPLLPGPYRLRPGDHVTVSVLGDDKLRATNQAIDADGNLPLPGFLMGPMSLRVGGLSVAELEAMIAKSYRNKDTGTEPRVNVRIDVYAPLKVSGPEDHIYGKYLRLVTPVEPAPPPAPR